MKHPPVHPQIFAAFLEAGVSQFLFSLLKTFDPGAARRRLPQKGGRDMKNLIMAASVVSLIPVSAVFLALQRYFIEGIATSGLKG